MQRELRTKRREDPEEVEDSPQPKLIRKKTVRSQGGSSTQEQPQVTPVVESGPEKETAPPQERTGADSGFVNEDPAPEDPRERLRKGKQPEEEAGTSRVPLPGMKRKLVLIEEEEPEGPENTPRKDKGPVRKKTTPLNKRPKEAGDDGEETGEEDNRRQETPLEEEPVQEEGPPGDVQEETEVPLRAEHIILQTRIALDMVTEQYTPMFAALRETGTLLRTEDALEYPARIRKLQRKLIRSREKESKLAGQLQGLQEDESESVALLKGLKEELQRKVVYIKRMEAQVKKNELQIREQEETIRRIGKTSQQCITKLSGLFHPDGEAQMKARLYDEKVGQPGLEGAARMKNVVREYSEKVEAYLIEFRELAEHMRGNFSDEEPGREETVNRGDRVGSGEGLQGMFNASTDAPQEGEIDRLMRTGSSTQEHTSRVRLDAEPIHMVRPAGVSPVEVRNLSEEMEAMDVQSEGVERQQGGPGGHPGSQPEGTQAGEPTGGRQVDPPPGHESRGARPTDPIMVDSPEIQEGQPMEDEPLPGTAGGPGLVVRI